MPGSLQNKLQQFEETPPPSVWNKIVERLNEEYVPGDHVIASKLDDASLSAPQGMWNRIDAELNGEEKTQKVKGRILPFRRIAAAAVLIGLIALGYLYFFSGEQTNQPQIVNNVPDNTVTKPLVADVLPQRNNNAPLVSARTKNVAKAPSSLANRRTYAVQIIEPASPEEAPLYDLNTVSALQPVSVSGPPLRDKSGNLILDLAMISNPDDPYITVTGPNGKQTKISSKFLSCLGYINGNISATEMDAKAIRCTAQFEEWRRKLLAEPEFIPTANNFFDIFELNDMLQEM